jgi:hypothetical protein
VSVTNHKHTNKNKTAVDSSCESLRAALGLYCVSSHDNNKAPNEKKRGLSEVRVRTGYTFEHGGSFVQARTVAHVGSNTNGGSNLIFPTGLM